MVTVPLDGQASLAQYSRELKTEIAIRKEDNTQAARS
jgi:hypothetical protein